MPVAEGFADRFLALLDQVALLARSGPGLEAVAGRAEEGRARVLQPMRLAVVGQIKKGKSTCVNALLGESVVPTGTLEVTFNVNELAWSPSPSVVVEFRDRPAEPRSFDELAALTARDPAQSAMLRSIRTVHVGLPNPLLRRFHLLDTPGLDSVYQDDQENTLRALGLSHDDLQEASAARLATADAMVFLFSRTLAAAGAARVTELQGPVGRSATPLTAIGVLNMCDLYWLEHDGPLLEVADRDPLDDGHRICARLMRDPRVARLFYALVPIAALPAAGAAALTDADVRDLARLALAPPERLVRALRDVEEFANEADAGVPLGAPARRRLVTLLGAYGVHVACRRLREGGDGDAVRQALVDASGMARLRSVVVSHFGNRSTVIKADTVLRSIEDGVAAARAAGGTGLVDRIADRVQQFRAAEASLAEFDVLSAHYRGRLGLGPAEVTEVLAVTGERGTSAPDRLGLPHGSPPGELARVARQRAVHWRSLAHEPGSDRERRHALRTLARSFEALADEIEWADAFLGGSVTIS